MSATTIASGLLTLGCLAASVKCHLDMKKMEESDSTMTTPVVGSASDPSKCKVKRAFMVGTVLFGAIFLAQLYTSRNPSGSFVPSSMHHTESDASFAKRVSAAAAKIRSQIDKNKPPTRSSADLAAMASAEISSFIANNV